MAVDLFERRSGPNRMLIATNDFACAQPARTTLIAARSSRAASFCSYRRRLAADGVSYVGEVLAAGIIRQGTSSAMRLMVCPAAILARISLR